MTAPHWDLPLLLQWETNKEEDEEEEEEEALYVPVNESGDICRESLIKD